MNPKEIEETCQEFAVNYDLEYDEYVEVLKASLEEAEQIHRYYTGE